MEEGLTQTDKVKADGRIMHEALRCDVAIPSRQGVHSNQIYGIASAANATRRAASFSDPITEESSVPGVYVAGDASRDVLLVAVAIAEGAKAAVAINRALLKGDGLG